MSDPWFEQLFGFREARGSAEAWAATKAQLELSADRSELSANGRSYKVGRFSCPSLAELREQAAAALGADLAAAAAVAGPLKLDHALGDISVLMGNHPNAVVQAASQFNCLEFVSMHVTPEEGVTLYTSDKTQGPACSVACGPATVYRNYLAPVPIRDDQLRPVGEEHEGQTAEHQLDNLADVCRLVGNLPRGRFYRVQGGYTLASDEGLRGLSQALKDLDREAVKAALRVGVHSDVQLTSTHWGRRLVGPGLGLRVCRNWIEHGHTLTQVFSSAVSITYSRNHAALWEPFGTLVLEATYEATLWAAVLHALAHRDDPGARVAGSWLGLMEGRLCS